MTDASFLIIQHLEHFEQIAKRECVFSLDNRFFDIVDDIIKSNVVPSVHSFEKLVNGHTNWVMSRDKCLLNDRSIMFVHYFRNVQMLQILMVQQNQQHVWNIDVQIVHKLLADFAVIGKSKELLRIPDLLVMKNYLSLSKIIDFFPKRFQRLKIFIVFFHTNGFDSLYPR